MNRAAEAIELLKRMIATPSISREEGATADIIESWLSERGVEVCRSGNNILAYSESFNEEKKTLLLCSHHDTVRPSAAYTKDPFTPTIEGDKLYGLGSNDAGASVVGLLSTFVEYYAKELPFNLMLAIVAEEEVMGEGGLRSLTDKVASVDMAIVGEPTQLDAAVGERGLVVLDCVAKGKSGHAARDEGENALYKAVRDITKLQNFSFEKCSELLGDIRMTTTMIECGTQHNVVPESCHYVVDCRTTDAYTNVEFVEIIKSELESEVTPRSTRIGASALDETHPLLLAAMELGSKPYVSPTTSDMALMSWATLKLGVGDSARSHTADEYILLSEVERGVEYYIDYIEKLAKYYEVVE